MGLHLAYLFSHFSNEEERDIPVTLAGQAAILADRLGYDLPSVSTVPEFNEPSAVLTAGGVTIAGPDVPTVDSRTSAARLFEEIRTDAAATLIQIPSGGGSPIETATCTVYAVPLRNHPSRTTIDSVIKTLAPIHLIILHETGQEADQYKDQYSSYVWVTGDRLDHTLLDKTGWTPPPWVSDQVEQHVTQERILPRQPINTGVLTDGGESELSPIERSPTPDLAAEGITPQAISRKVEREKMETTVNNTYRVEASEAVEQPAATSVTTPAVVKRLTALNDRITTLETAINQQLSEHPRQSARVLDVHDGVTILRLDDEINVEPGDTVDILPPS